jgi:hypothetical protein
MAGGSAHSDPWRIIALGAAIVILFVFLTKGVRLQNVQDDPSNSQQTNSPLLPVDNSGEDPFAIEWLETKLRDLDLQPSSFKVSHHTGFFLMLLHNCFAHFFFCLSPLPPSL